MKLPQETRDFFSIPLRHPIAFAVAYSPAVVSLLIGFWVYRPNAAMLFPLAIAVFFCLFVLDGIFSGRVSDNLGTAIRSKDPIRFWGKWAIWTVAYLFLALAPIGFAFQERDKEQAASASVPVLEATNR